MAINIEVKFVFITFEKSKKHNDEKNELQLSLNSGWRTKEVWQFDPPALVYELRRTTQDNTTKSK